MKTLKIINIICFSLLIIGGLNWLTIGLFQFDFVASIFGSQSAVVSRIIFSLVGFSAIYLCFIPFVQRGNIRFDVNNNVR